MIWYTRDDFLRALGHVISEERGFVDAEGDRGGRTIFGISERSHPEAWTDGTPSLERAADIYWSDYWTEAGCDQLSSPAVQDELFNTAVLMGPGAAVRKLQQAVNLFQPDVEDIAVDGRFGPETREAVKGFRDPEALAGYMNVLQGCAILEIVERDPSQRRFLRGWLRRVAFTYGD